MQVFWLGALELRQRVDVGTNLTRKLRWVVLAFDAHDDALGVDRIDEAVTLGKNQQRRSRAR